MQQEDYNSIQKEYPAHLHINILPEFQGSGIEQKLLNHFENHLQCLAIKGIHLHTSNYHKKAIPFYHKMGYYLIRETRIPNHPLYNDFSVKIFGKKLDK